MNKKKYFQILGSGHSESISHYNNNALVKSDEGIMLIDCGHTIKHALSTQNLSFNDVDAIFITHVHGDHVFGLERAAYESKFTYNKRIKLILHESLLTDLWEHTLKGSLGSNSDGEASLDDYFDVILIEGNSFKSLGNNYSIFPVKHTPNKPTFGLCLNEQVFWSSDTTAIPETIGDISFSVGFHDATLSRSNPVHATLKSLIDHYPLQTRKKLYLMSYEDNWLEYKNLVDREFKGFALQGMKVEYD